MAELTLQATVASVLVYSVMSIAQTASKIVGATLAMVFVYTTLAGKFMLSVSETRVSSFRVRILTKEWAGEPIPLLKFQPAAIRPSLRIRASRRPSLTPWVKDSRLSTLLWTCAQSVSALLRAGACRTRDPQSRSSRVGLSSTWTGHFSGSTASSPRWVLRVKSAAPCRSVRLVLSCSSHCTDSDKLDSRNKARATTCPLVLCHHLNLSPLCVTGHDHLIPSFSAGQHLIILIVIVIRAFNAQTTNMKIVFIVSIIIIMIHDWVVDMFNLFLSESIFIYYNF